MPDADTESGSRAQPSLGDLIAQIATDLSTLLRQEVALAKAELRQSVSSAGQGAGMLGGAALAGWMAILFVTVACWWGLGSLIHARGWAALIVAVVWAIIAAILLQVGRARLRAVEGMPRTMETAKQVPSALTGNEDQP